MNSSCKGSLRSLVASVECKYVLTHWILHLARYCYAAALTCCSCGMQFYLGRHEYGDVRDHAIANLDKLGHRLDAFPLL